MEICIQKYKTIVFKVNMKYKVLYKGNLYKFSRVNVIQTTFSDLNIIKLEVSKGKTITLLVKMEA